MGMSAKVVAVIVLFAMALGGAVSFALLEGGVEYRTVPALLSSSYEGERVKVRAEVVRMLNDFKPTVFVAADIPADGARLPADAPSITVEYSGDDVPQGLQRAAHVTLEGRFNRERGVFEATMLQTQCPSRYEGQELVPIDDGQEPSDDIRKPARP
jgi:hypothetical protein